MQLRYKLVDAARRERLDEIVASLARETGVTTERILSRDRHSDVAAVRHMLFLKLWESGIGLAPIGRMLGYDHTTVRSGIIRMLGEDEYVAAVKARAGQALAAKDRAA